MRRRILLVLTVAAIMAALMASSAVPAFAKMAWECPGCAQGAYGDGYENVAIVINW